MSCMLNIPPIDARRMQPKQVTWSDWMPPLLLLEFKATDGKPIYLCDFASAGEAGTPHCSWLPIRNCPDAPIFSRENALQTSRVV